MACYYRTTFFNDVIRELSFCVVDGGGTEPWWIAATAESLAIMVDKPSTATKSVFVL